MFTLAMAALVRDAIYAVRADSSDADDVALVPNVARSLAHVIPDAMMKAQSPQTEPQQLTALSDLQELPDQTVIQAPDDPASIAVVVPSENIIWEDGALHDLDETGVAYLPAYRLVRG